ncbi:MAG: phosphotransferase [Candidatus Aegiribacteria sp.]|nr:phosphotransferase [Candidatus Aegiribacteria sp.]MBD3294622.1 phosphotransferase [Candidatus Fermentibacteria bacterium]
MTDFCMNFRDLLRRDDLCRNLVERICSEHDLASAAKWIKQGSNILYQLEDASVLKIFSPDEVDFCENETLFLRNLRGRLPVETPVLLSSGVFETFPFILMSELRGRPLSSIWERMDREQKRKICRETGRLLRELHSLPLSVAEGCVPQWPSFIQQQKDYLLENHINYGIRANRLCEISRFIKLGEPVEERISPVVCHTEIMLEHLFADTATGEPVLTGLLDFEPSMKAIPHYDLCSAGLFVTAGDSELFRTLIEAYRPAEPIDPMDVTRMLLLHRYSNLNWFMGMLPKEQRSCDIETLGRYWFGH